MITTNSLLRIDTFETHDLAYLISSPDRYKITRSITQFLVDIKITPISRVAYNACDAKISTHIKKKLLQQKIVIHEENKNKPEATIKFFRLDSYNWRLASDYLERTRDYKFFDYAKDGWQKDARMMAKYLDEGSEMDRSKIYTDVDYKSWRYTAAEAITFSGPTCGLVGIDFVLNTVVATVGKLRAKPLSQGVPILQKSIPSGGSRHPTEAYILDVNSKVIYHFNSEKNAFGAIGTWGNKSYSIFFGEPEVYVQFPVRYVVLLTCVWERNMFRYREPRTFRSVHLDAGHAACNIEVICQKARVRYKVQYGMNSKDIETSLNIDPYVEGLMAAVMIGDKKWP